MARDVGRRVMYTPKLSAKMVAHFTAHRAMDTSGNMTDAFRGQGFRKANLELPPKQEVSPEERADRAAHDSGDVHTLATRAAGFVDLGETNDADDDGENGCNAGPAGPGGRQSSDFTPTPIAKPQRSVV